jgi:hypothetical protein
LSLCPKDFIKKEKTKMLRKNQEVFSQPRDNLGQAPSHPQLWVVARSNCLLANSTDSDAGDKTTNLPLFIAMSNFKSEMK